MDDVWSMTDDEILQQLTNVNSGFYEPVKEALYERLVKKHEWVPSFLLEHKTDDLSQDSLKLFGERVSSLASWQILVLWARISEHPFLLPRPPGTTFPEFFIRNIKPLLKCVSPMLLKAYEEGRVASRPLGPFASAALQVAKGHKG